MKVSHAVNEEWLYGEIGGRCGQFPVQFIDHVPAGIQVLGGGQQAGSTEDIAVKSKPICKLEETLALWDQPDDKVFIKVFCILT